MKIMFFSPYSAIWEHSFPEALVARALKTKGHDVSYMSCDRVYEAGCVSMVQYGVKPNDHVEKKHSICNLCTKRGELLAKKFNINNYSLSSYITKDIKDHVKDLIDGRDDNDLINLSIGECKIGEIATYNIIIKYKKQDINFNEAELSDYKVEVLNALLTYFAVNSVFDSIKLDKLFVYNSLYSTNRVIIEVAKSRGIDAYFLHAGASLSNRLSYLMIGEGTTYDSLFERKKNWNDLKDRPSSKTAIESVSRHMSELLIGKSPFAYSAGVHKNFNLRDEFDIPKGKKILLATMSSYDEMLSAKISGVFKNSGGVVFEDQIDWISEIIEFVRSRNDLHFVVRVHPREFPNSRDTVKAHHAKNLEKLFDNIPNNVSINWPNQNISLYVLASQVDVVLNAWSSAGKELSALGLPVITHEPNLIIYPTDLNYIAHSRDEYFSLIEEAILKGWSLDKCITSFRWLALELYYSVIDLGKDVHIKDVSSLSLLEKLIRGVSLKSKTNFMDVLECNLVKGQPMYADILEEVLFNDDIKSVEHVQYKIKGSHEVERTQIICHLEKLFNAIGASNLLKNINS